MNKQEFASIRYFKEKAAKAAAERSPDYLVESKHKQEHSRLLLARISFLKLQDLA